MTGIIHCPTPVQTLGEVDRDSFMQAEDKRLYEAPRWSHKLDRRFQSSSSNRSSTQRNHSSHSPTSPMLVGHSESFKRQQSLRRPSLTNDTPPEVPRRRSSSARKKRDGNEKKTPYEPYKTIRSQSGSLVHIIKEPGAEKVQYVEQPITQNGTGLQKRYTKDTVIYPNSSPSPVRSQRRDFNWNNVNIAEPFDEDEARIPGSAHSLNYYSSVKGTSSVPMYRETRGDPYVTVAQQPVMMATTVSGPDHSAYANHYPAGSSFESKTTYNVVPVVAAEPGPSHMHRTQSASNLRLISRPFDSTKLDGTEEIHETEEVCPGPDADSEVIVRRRIIRKKKVREGKSSPELATTTIKIDSTSPTRPHRAMSQTNVFGGPSATRITNTWTSDSNIKGTLGSKSNYSAHRENLRQQEVTRQHQPSQQEQWQSARNINEMGGAEFLEELETITLQPIGRGVQNLDSSVATAVRPSRTPTRYDRFGNQNGFRGSRPQSPMSTYNRQGSNNYEGHQQMRATSAASGGLTGGMYHTQNSYAEQRQISTTHQQQQQHQQQHQQQQLSSHRLATTHMDHVDMDSMVFDGSGGGMRLVQDCANDWFQPNVSRELAINSLRDARPGSFVIRKSTTFQNSYGLALKVDKLTPKMSTRMDDNMSETVRHFLIESVQMADGRGGMGVHLRGFETEPVYPNLASFVYHHTQVRGSLPCLLYLPALTTSLNSPNMLMMNGGFGGSQRNLVSSPRPPPVAVTNPNNSEVLYLGSFDVDRLTSEAAVRRAVTDLLGENSRLTKRCYASIKVVPNDGIFLVDQTKRTYMNKQIRPSHILWCGFDPENRIYSDTELAKSRGLSEAKIFGLVCKKQRVLLHENTVHMMCETTPGQAASLILCINNTYKLHPGKY